MVTASEESVDMTEEAVSVSVTTEPDTVVVRTFPERLRDFRQKLTDGEDKSRLVHLAESLYVSAPRADLKTRLELGFYLLEHYSSKKELDRAQQLNAEVLAILEAIKGGKGFQEHQTEKEKVSGLSAEWGETEP